MENPTQGKVGIKTGKGSAIQSLRDQKREMRNDRTSFDDQYRDIKDLVRPLSPDFTQNTTGQATHKGDRLHDNVFDGTAIWASEQMANGIHSLVLNPQERWFSLGVKGRNTKDLSDEWKAYLENTTDSLFHHFNIPRVNFAPAFHEFFLDLVSFGTAVMMEIFDHDTGIIRFRPYPLADCWLAENANNEIDVIFRETRMTARQIKEKFGQSNGTIDQKILDEKDSTKRFLVTHAVLPRKDRVGGSKTKTNKAFASYYFCEETEDIFEEGGYDTFPYIVARWSKLAGEKYGRSPAMTCLPDIQMVNRMMKEIIVSAQLANRPPIVMEEDGFLLPISQSPGALIWKEQGVDFPQPLNSGIRVDIPFEVVNQYREHITRCFMVDLLKQEFKKERQTAFEIADSRDEKLRAMSPALSRMEIEVLGPLLGRTIALLEDAEIIGPPPEDGVVFDIVYNSPASKAQTASKAVELGRAIQDAIPMGQVFPEFIEAFHPSRLAEEMLMARSVSIKVLRTDEELSEIAQQKQEAQQTEQMQGMASAGGDAAGALKDVASAQESGINLGL